MRPDLGKLMQQVQEMQQKQEEIAQRKITGKAGGDLVEISMNGNYEADKIGIDTSLVPGLSPEDIEILGDLICAAINDASHKIKKASQSALPDFGKDFKLPDGLGLDKLFK